MNTTRRGFVGKAFAAIAAIFTVKSAQANPATLGNPKPESVAPYSALAPQQHSVDPYKWLAANRRWMDKWLFKARHTNEAGGQIFRDTAYLLKNRNFSQRHLDGMAQDVIEHHSLKILLASVFGIKSSGEQYATISGFKEQMGRLPTESDKVTLYFSEADSICEYVTHDDDERDRVEIRMLHVINRLEILS